MCLFFSLKIFKLLREKKMAHMGFFWYLSFFVD